MRRGEYCGACDAEEGELHKLGCDYERCPLCGDQLIACECPQVQPLLDGELDDDDDEAYPSVLQGVGRVPYIRYPLLCPRCGSMWPEMHRDKVGEERWDRYIQIDMRHHWLCAPCFERIQDLIDRRSGL